MWKEAVVALQDLFKKYE